MAFNVQDIGIKGFKRMRRGPGNGVQDLTINSMVDNKTVKINSRDYVQASGDSIGFQTTPNQTVTTTGEVYGAQFKPRAASNVGVGSVNGVGIDAELKSGTGSASGDVRGMNVYLGATGSGTISGDAVVIRARAEVSATVTGDVVFAKILSHEGSKSWEGLVKFVSSADGNTAVGSHSLLTANNAAHDTTIYATVPCVVKGVGTKYIKLFDPA